MPVITTFVEGICNFNKFNNNDNTNNNNNNNISNNNVGINNDNANNNNESGPRRRGCRGSRPSNVKPPRGLTLLRGEILTFEG